MILFLFYLNFFFEFFIVFLILKGPDQYFEKTMRNYKGIENDEEFTNILLDESLLEEESETLHINELHCSINPKLLPKEPSSIIKESNLISEIQKSKYFLQIL